ncbi:MAG: dienelactone hydrolase family protein [Deltaproteobacteria bacterium]|nr:dienelactone hydrolase family protein [Deltaproteobacteria bacterium]
MSSSWEETKVDDSLMKLYVASPAGTGPHPAVVVIQHQGGVDEFVQEMTRRISDAGYVAAAPDLYHRDSPDCQDDAPIRRGRLRDVTVIQDVNAAVAHLNGLRSVDGRRLGIVGFCMGGRVAYLMAAANPGFKAAVSYYGGGILQPWGDGVSPCQRTAEISCPILGHFGEEDKNPSPEDMRKLDAELSKHGKAHEFHSYGDTGHGFMNRHSSSYRAHADKASWPRTLEFFRKYLSESTGQRSVASL